MQDRMTARHDEARRTTLEPDAASTDGVPLHDALRTGMERSFDADFSAIRVHAESQAARTIGARAFARGRALHFAPGEYEPTTAAGRELIGHELAHVVQQSAGRVSTSLQGAGRGVVDDQALEREADEAGARAARGQSAGLPGGSWPMAAATILQGKFEILRGNKYVDGDKIPQPKQREIAFLHGDEVLAEVKDMATRDHDFGTKSWPEIITIAQKNVGAPQKKKAKASHGSGKAGGGTGDGPSLDELYGYDSEELSENERAIDLSKTLRLKRTNGKIVDAPEFSPPTAVKHGAHSIRRFRKRKATPEDRKSFVTRFNGAPFEYQPNALYKDVGMYPLKRSESGSSWMRDGKAKPYAEIGSAMDSVVRHEKTDVATCHRDVGNILRAQPPAGITGQASIPVLNDTAAVYVTDMMRSSIAPREVEKNCSNNTDSFSKQFGGRTPSYPPANRGGGSKYLQDLARQSKEAKQEEEEEEEKKARGGDEEASSDDQASDSEEEGD